MGSVSILGVSFWNGVRYEAASCHGQVSSNSKTGQLFITLILN
uniref:Uncharacterized protein n=1 Tax=Arundo donax TaxID=35708 RepID=A0A0A8Z2T3_ARUDO